MLRTHGFDLDAVLDALADKVAGKLAERLQGLSESPWRRLLTVDAAADYLGRTRQAVQHLISSGQLPTVRSGRRVFVDLRDLQSWIEKHKV